jgi:hypothetical protein
MRRGRRRHDLRWSRRVRVLADFATAYRDAGLTRLLQENDGQDVGLYLRPAIALYPHLDRTGTPGRHRAQQMTRGVRANLAKVRAAVGHSDER